MGTETGTETASCTKCTREIPIEADRCPECGYEPGPGILGGIVMWLSFSAGLFFALIAIVALITIADGFPAVQGLTVAGATGFIAAIFFAVVRAGYKNGQRGPTDPPAGGESSTGGSESLSESLERGKQRGEEINAAYHAAVQSLPEWLWTVGVLLGCAVSLIAWPTALADDVAAMGFSLLIGGGMLFFVILADARRLNDVHEELHFRWWFWSILAAIPLFGWLFGLAWLWRRRQKTGDVA